MALRFDTIDNLLRLQRDIERYFGKPLFEAGLSGGNAYPQINVFANGEGDLVIKAEVPGVAPEALGIEVEPRRLTLSGERLGAAQEKSALHRRERGTGKFSRTIQLPGDLDTEHARAALRNGVLTVTIPKHAQARPRKISVQPA